MSNQLVEIKKFLATDDLVCSVQDSYIEMTLKLHPQCKPSAIIEHINAIQLSGANPFKKQVYFTSYFSKKLGYSIGTTVFAYRFFEDQANKTNEFEGCDCLVEVGEYFEPEKGEVAKTLKATATAKRKGRSDVTFVAWYPEFVQKGFNGKPQSVWADKPHTMLRKCAIAGALRSQFPETVGTFLIEEEVNKEFDADAEKIAELQNDVETTAKTVEKEEKMLEDMKERPTKEKLLVAITALCSEITTNMTKDNKVKWMSENLKVDNFGRLKTFKVAELKNIAEKLEKLKSQPIVLDKAITTKDIPFD